MVPYAGLEVYISFGTISLLPWDIMLTLCLIVGNPQDLADVQHIGF